MMLLIKQTITFLLIAIGLISPQNVMVEKTNTGSNYTQAEALEMVKRHNKYRKEVGVPEINWSNEAAQFAQEWANHLAKNCMMKHSNNKQYGENVFKGYGKSYTPTYVADVWASEKADWKGGKITYKNYADAGHYTQMIWYSSTKMGCGTATCADGSVIVSCSYSPSGNMVGEDPTGK